MDPQRSNAPLDVIATVTGVAPPNGSSAGGTDISLVGTGFTGASDVLFGAADITATCPSAGGCFTFVDDSDITAQTPPGSSGAVDITVTTGAGPGTANPPNDDFTFFDPPTVGNVASPQPEGATGISVTGHNFSDPGTGNNGVSEVDLVPTNGATGPTVALTTVCATAGSPDCFAFNSDTSLSINLPNSMAAGQYDTEVTTPGGTSAQSSNDFLVVQQVAPVVSGVSPDVGPNGGGSPEITITGSGFTASDFTTSDLFFDAKDVPAASSFPCSGSASGCFQINSATSISAYPPSGSGQADITVQTESTDGISQQTSNTSAADTFAYAPVPTVANVVPGTGPTLGANSVTLTGTGFESNNGAGADYTTTNVVFGGTTITTNPCSGSPSAPCFTVSNATTIVVGYVPAHAAGTVDITVTTPGGTSNTSVNDQYLYAVLPTVTDVNPNVGAITGVNTVTLTGTAFTGATDVFVGSTDVGSSPCGSAPCFTVNSPTSITLKLPSHAAGTVDIEVSAPGGRSAPSGNDQYTFDAVPTVTNVVPPSGPTTAGTTITVSGTGFTGATDVFVGGADVTNICGSSNCYTVNSATSITVILPAQAAGQVDVRVETPGGESLTNSNDQYTFVGVPTVTDVSPSSGPSTGGNQITVTGTLFSGATDVFVGGADVTNVCGSSNCYTVVNSTTITVNLPAQSAGPAVDVRVETVGGESATSASDKYTFLPGPTVTGVSPNVGSVVGGNTVTLTGTAFTGATDVFVGATDVTNVCGSAPCYTVDTATSITLKLPSHASGTVDIEVVTAGGRSIANPPNDQYTFDAVPTVTNVVPSSGPMTAGTTITVTGTSFTGATDVFVGAADVTNICGSSNCYTVNSATSITVILPAQAAGTVDVEVFTPGGRSLANSPNDNYTFVAPPTVTGVSPSSGPSSGGNQVTVTGTLFTGATDVFVGAADVTSVCGSPPCYTVVNPSTITVKLPTNQPAGQVDVRVETIGGESTVSAGDKYTFVATPTVTNVVPDAGPIAGGTPVVLTGTGFTGATDVFVDTTDVGTVCGAAPCFTVNTPTQITVLVPSHGAANNVDITVQTIGGVSTTTSNDQYSYVVAPTVTNVSPAIGPIGGNNTVTISGTAFESVGNWSASSVSIGSGITTQCPGSPGAPCFTLNSSTSITVSNVPAHAAGAVDVTVTTPGGTSTTSSNDTYTYATLPTVTAVSPPAGPAGVVTSTVTLTGTAFMSGTFTTSDVFFGGLDITNSPCPGSPSSPCFTVNSATQIVVQAVPAHAAATVDITVQTPLGTSAVAPPGDTFAWAPVPTVTNVSPNNGSTSGGIAVAVTGTGFEAAPNYTTTALKIGTTSCAVTSCFVVNSPTMITIASIPAGAGGQDDITVTTIGGTSAPNPPRDVFTYIANLPTVTSLSPSSGATSGLAIVTITGANYGVLGSGFAPTAVTFGGLPPVTTTPCPSSSPTSPCFTRLDANRISVATPSTTTAGPVNVTVTTGAGTSNNPVTYTYIAPGAYSALTPYRVCDTRASPPHTECSGLTLTGSRHTVTVQITGVVVNTESVPSGAQAVVVNLTAINHSAGADFISAFPAGAATPNVSNINVDGGRTQANLAIVALSTSGAITLYNPIGSVDVLVDVEGYFAHPTGPAGTFHTFPPVRICDTRANTHTACATTANQPLGGGKWRDVVVSGLPPGGTGVGIPADGTAASAVLNLTAVGPTLATYLSVAPPNSSDQCPTSPLSSNLNPKAGETEPNRVISPLGPRHDICVFNGAGSVNFIIDINGWFGKGTESTLGAHFYAVPPTRICDTRANSHTFCAGKFLTTNFTEPVAVAGVLTVPAFTTTTPPVAIVANLTAVAGTANTFFLLYPSDAAHRPGSSDLNPAAKDVIANLAVVSLATTGAGAGEVDLYNALGTINALLDVAGWFQ